MTEVVIGKSTAACSYMSHPKQYVRIGGREDVRFGISASSFLASVVFVSYILSTHRICFIQQSMGCAKAARKVFVMHINIGCTWSVNEHQMARRAVASSISQYYRRWAIHSWPFKEGFAWRTLMQVRIAHEWTSGQRCAYPFKNDLTVPCALWMACEDTGNAMVHSLRRYFRNLCEEQYPSWHLTGTATLEQFFMGWWVRPAIIMYYISHNYFPLSELVILHAHIIFVFMRHFFYIYFICK